MLDVRPAADRRSTARAIGAIGQYFNPPPDEEFSSVCADPPARADARGVRRRRDRRRRGCVPVRAVRARRLAPVRGHHRRRRHPDASPTRRPPGDDGRAAPRRPRARRADRGALGLGGDDLRTLRLRHRLVGRRPEAPARVGRLRRAARAAGTTRFVTPEEAAELFPPVYEAVRRAAPRDAFARNERWWALRQLRVRPEHKSAPKRFVVVELDGEVQAYAIYRTHFDFAGGSSASRLNVIEALGATPQATAAIWRFLLDVDWMAGVELSLAPAGSSAPAAARRSPACPLWARRRPLDPARRSPRRAHRPHVRRRRPARARRARRGLSVERRTLEARGGTCDRTDDEPDLSLDVSALGSAYLGAVSFAQLHAALRVEELRNGAVSRADALFAHRPLPWCLEIF